MTKVLEYGCHACNSEVNDFFIATRAMMHKANKEEYRFHICSVCQAVFLTNPVSLELLDNCYTDNYLPYQGSAVWGKYRSFLFSAVSFMKLFQRPGWEIVGHLRYGTMDAFTLWWQGRMEKKGINWSGNMESEFWPFVLLKMLTLPVFVFEKFLPLGIQTLVVKKKI